MENALFEAMEDSFVDEEENGAILAAVMNVTAALCVELQKHDRRFKMYNRAERVNWSDHVALLLHRKEFADTYRMEHDTFKFLVDTLREKITFNVAITISENKMLMSRKY